jgi:signal transduction histidine kinase
MSWLQQLYSTADLTPHGFCLYWRPELLWLQVVPDSLIGLSYYSIPVALGYFVWKRHDVVFGWIFWLFAAFILACGTTHLVEIWTLWHPDYATQGLIKAATAGVSLITAILLWPLLPKALALPSPAALRRVNEELSRQIGERNAAVEALEREMHERQQAEEALRQSQKMEGLGQLTGGVAHDFNNLLLILEGNLAILRDKTAEDPRLEPQIAAIERALGRGGSLTRQLLTFARRQMLQPRSIELREEMAKMVELMRRSLRGDIEVKLDIASGLWPIMADPHELELALINIASNARDAMPTGGTLAIAVDNETLTGKEAGLHGLAGDFVRLAVADTGAGIPAEILPQIFEPFFTTKEVGKGTGLGLSQVYGFATQSRGAALVESTPGAGTVVSLYLPRAAAAATAGARPTEDESVAAASILLVEDNAEIAELGGSLLRRHGYTVRLAENAQEALAIAAQERFDLVFSDIVMPGGMNGVELARRIREMFPSMPVLLTTGYSSKAGAAASEGFPIISKPYPPDALRHAIQDLLRRQRG